MILSMTLFVTSFRHSFLIFNRAAGRGKLGFRSIVALLYVMHR